MKTYEKPRLMSISLNGNEQLCGSCSAEGSKPIIGNPTLEKLYKGFDKDGDGVFSKDEQTAAFDAGVGCTSVVTGLCKFTSGSDSMTSMVAWS